MLKDTNYNQKHLQEQIAKYLLKKAAQEKDITKTPTEKERTDEEISLSEENRKLAAKAVEESEGYCGGLTLLWAYYQFYGDTSIFFKLLKSISEWNGNEIGAGTENAFEKLFNLMTWLHESQNYIPSYTPAYREKIFNLVTSFDVQIIENPEQLNIASLAKQHEPNTYFVVKANNKWTLYFSGIDKVPHAIPIENVPGLKHVLDPTKSIEKTKKLAAIRELIVMQITSSLLPNFLRLNLVANFPLHYER